MKPILDTKPFRLFVTDIDGTLVRDDVHISEEIRLSVRRAEALGMRTSLASGRNAAELEWFASVLDVNEPYIALGGAYIGEPGNLHPLVYEALPYEIVQEVLHLARSNDLGAMIEYPRKAYYEGPFDFYSELQSLTVSELTYLDHPDQLPLESPSKLVLIGTDEYLRKMEKKLQHYRHNIDFSRSLPHLIDITRRGFNKGTALSRVAEHLAVPLSSIAVAGDGLNDLPMFQVAGFSIAMADADENLKAHADAVVPNDASNGFLWALEYLTKFLPDSLLDASR
jgi:Cof subfamily protein (haloacid dehalogenase superfamily)